jgi:hypothetical protein
LLKATEQFIFLAFGEGQIIVGQVGVFLLQLAFNSFQLPLKDSLFIG